MTAVESHQTFELIIEILGGVAFAISGIRLAAAKRFDWFGAYVIGFVTAIGGGTLRDLLIGSPVFWLTTPFYLCISAVSLLTVIIFRQALVKGMRTMFLFDAIGLALYVVIGIEKTLQAGYPMMSAITMGIITGSFGGVTRDILIGDVPMFFRKDVYATACLAGGIVYWLVSYIPITPIVAESACAVTVIGLRVLATHYNWSLPILQIEDSIIPEDNKGEDNKIINKDIND
ncbi:MAG: trimeric intracellular cation channel family protein [Muribaculaceae bacterium]|nr:trimeric intracellular cation channel family protein [Muribaculaceae bacterium]